MIIKYDAYKNIYDLVFWSLIIFVLWILLLKLDIIYLKYKWNIRRTNNNYSK